MRFNFGFLQMESWTRETPDDWMGSGCWIRFFGWGLHFTNGPKHFSERNGYEKRLHLPFGYRVKFLRRGK